MEVERIAKILPDALFLSMRNKPSVGRQNVHQKTAYEFVSIEFHDFPCVTASIVFFIPEPDVLAVIAYPQKDV